MPGGLILNMWCHLLDAVGGNGMLLVVKAEDEDQARQLEEEIEQFRN